MTALKTLTPDEFAALYETTRDLGIHYDLSIMLKAIVDRARQLMGVARGVLYLYDESRHDLELVVDIWFGDG